MKFFILTIFCNLLSSGHLQETNNVDDYNLNQPDGGTSVWPVQTFHTVQGNFYDQAQRSVVPKPCSRRSSSETEPITQQLSPPLASKVPTLNSAAAPLKPHALRNAEYDSKKTVNQVPLSNSQHTIDSNKLLKTINSITINNPVIDSTEEMHHEIIPPNNNEIQEDNPKPSDQMRSAPTSDSLSSLTSGVKSTAGRRNQPLPIAPDSEYGAQPESHYISEQNNAISSEPNGLRSIHINKPYTDKSEIPGFLAIFDHMETQTLPPALVDKLLSRHNESAALPNKCSHDKETHNLIGHSRRSMSSYNDEENANDIFSNDKDYIRHNNEPHMESRLENENALASVLNAEKNTPKSNKDQGLRSLDKLKLSPHEKSVSRVRPPFNEARREMIEPTKGAGMMGQSALMLMQSERICYACSTANNPSCWAPDRRTTVKYCRKGNNACLTKTFGQGRTFTLIRDCGRSCDDSDTAGIIPRYNSCSMCHSELCNGAFSINGHSIIFALILTAVVKYLNYTFGPTF